MTPDVPSPTPTVAADQQPAPGNGTAAGSSEAGEAQHRPHGGIAALSLAALGVVFGDIGTSPLYSMQTLFSLEHNRVQPTPFNVYGIISLVIWSITIIVSVKYVTFIMRADNEGEGGTLALVALLRSKLADRRTMVYTVTVMGILGAALFYGDSVITPAISVMSAVEGLSLVNGTFERLVLPLSVAILVLLFAVQRKGTSVVGKAFGPVMALWFFILGLLGIPHILEHPQIVSALLPHHAVLFVVEDPGIGFLAMGAVVLTITGAEALYADMGHFGPKPIRLAWFGFVFPALTLHYLGQGAMIIGDPDTIDNPFFRMAPDWARVPLVIVATLATVIASQAVISGAFSVSRQATRLSLMPRMLVKHTSKHEGGQIYVPMINWILMTGVLLLILVFPSSTHLASAYGLAVTCTLVLETLLFGLLAHQVWHWGWARLLPLIGLLLVLEGTFLAGNLAKIVSGGWLPLSIAAVLVVIMTTWMRGSALAKKARRRSEGDMDRFVAKVNEQLIPRVPGTAVFPHPDGATVPLALKQNLMFNRVLHEQVIILTVVNEPVPHVRHVDRIRVNDLGNSDDGIYQIECHVGFNDSQDVPKAIATAAATHPDLDVDVDDVIYFLSLGDIRLGDGKGLATWRKRLFMLLQHNQAASAQAFRLPASRTVVMGARVEI